MRIIRGSSSPAEARAALVARDWPIAEIAPYIRLVEAVEMEVTGDTYRLSDIQVRAILDLRLHRLTALGRDEIGDELKTLAESIAELLAILADRAKLYEVMREELAAVRTAFATPRKTEIAAAADGIDDEDLIEREDMVVTVTMQGYIKRTHARHVPRAAPRRQGPRRHGDQGRGYRHQAVRDEHAHAGAVLLDRAAKSIA